MPPVVSPPSAQREGFSDGQEADLGDLMAESATQNLTLVDDAAVNQHLRDVGNQLIHYLPPNDLRCEFVLVDISDANAFSLPGSRVYVSRKLAALS